MMRTGYRMLDNVRTINDMRAVEENPLERYNIPRYWLELELLGVSSFFDYFDKKEEPPHYSAPAAKKGSLIIDNIVSRSIPLFLRL